MPPSSDTAVSESLHALIAMLTMKHRPKNGSTESCRLLAKIDADCVRRNFINLQVPDDLIEVTRLISHLLRTHFVGGTAAHAIARLDGAKL
jgi:hypothetical protein